MNLRGLGLGLVAAVALAANLLVPAKASADVLDCRVSCFQTFQGALWISTNSASTGTGVIDSFVRLSTNGSVEDGHNTSGRPLKNDENSSPQFTRDLVLQDVPVFTILGTTYYEFLLDVNQTSSSPLLSLNEVRICTSASAGLTATDTCPGTFQYQMGGFNDASNYVLINYALDNGSGSGDLFMYIPTSQFSGAVGTDYVYLFSQFGYAGANTQYGDTTTNDGFEEWATRICTLAAPCTPPVPEPASLVLFGTGLAGIAIAARRRFIL